MPLRIEDIRPGKKYYHSLATNTRSKITGLRYTQVSTIYVLEVNSNARTVLASINGAPAEWIPQTKFVRWTETKPNEDL